MFGHGKTLRGQAARAAQALRGEDTRQNGPGNAAYAVHTEDVEGIIYTQQALETTHAPDAQRAYQHTHDDGTQGPHEACGRGDRHQP